MKRTVREKNSIIIGFVFYLILVIILIIFSAFDIANKLKVISSEKIETQKLYNERVAIEKEGLSFDEFKNLSKGYGKDEAIIESLSKEFYDKHLKNNTNESFSDFIKKKRDELNSDENKKLIQDNKKQIINILPTYSENNLNIGGNNLTDYQFVNYVESIFETFGLSTDGAIGIGRITLLDDYAVSSSAGDVLESSIYYIPLSINLKGTKKNIVDFLYFIEKVGTIKVNNNELTIIKDDGRLSTNGLPKVLVGDKYKKGYNIFEHQIIDISSISMKDYIDDSYSSRRNESLSDFIKEKQGNEEFEIKVNLNFYVKGQPKFEVLNFIDEVMDNFKAINIEVNKMISSGNVKGIRLIKLKKQQNLLKNLNVKVIGIRKDLRSQKNLEDVYKKTIELNEFLSPMCEDLEGVCK